MKIGKTLTGFTFAAALGALVGAPSASADMLTGNLTGDNEFFAYISHSASSAGTLISQGTDWTQTYALNPTNLGPGTYYLNIEVHNDGGPGAFIGDFFIGGHELLTSTSGWLGIYNDSSGGQQPWVTPTVSVVDEGANGVGPWGTRPGISSSAHWIWPGDANSWNGSACQSCTVDLQLKIVVPGAVPEPGTLALFAAALLALGGLSLRRKFV
jgi:PEP-CTERM motif